MVNRVTLLGRVGKDPDVKHTNTGKVVASFSLATSEKWKDQSGQSQERTEWHNIVAWGKLAEIIGQYVKKGKQLYIEGRIQTEKYEKDGQQHYATKIVADVMKLLGDSGGRAESAPAAAVEPAPTVTDDDSLPF